MNVRIEDKNNIPKLVAGMQDIMFRVSKKVGEYFEGKILDMMHQQYPGWPALAASTIANKGSTKAWIDTGELWEQITYRVATGNLNSKIEIGIFDHEKAFIAQCLEYGTTNTGAIMAAGMMHQWSKTHIPERSLFRLVFDLEEENVIQMIESELGKEIKGLMI